MLFAMLIVRLTIKHNIYWPQLYLLRSSHMFRPQLAIIRDPLFEHSSEVFSTSRLFNIHPKHILYVCDKYTASQTEVHGTKYYYKILRYVIMDKTPTHALFYSTLY